ncbi:MAG: TfoX/Sxy family protein [Nitrospiraceae bacterium]
MNDQGFKEFVLDQLHDLSGVTCRAMFGGYGLYCEKRFFGIIHRGCLYFKTNEAGRAAYIQKGMKPFRPNVKQTLKTYYEVPVEILEDGGQLSSGPEGFARPSSSEAGTFTKESPSSFSTLATHGV